MTYRRNGMSLIELIIVLAMVGILAGIGFTRFNFGGLATRQAAQVVASAVNLARLEAIRQNETVGLEIQVVAGGTGAIRVCNGVDLTQTTLACSADAANTLRLLSFGDGDLARARLASVSPTGGIYFDRRGIMRNPQSHSIGLTDRAGANGRTVNVSASGRTVVE